MTDKEIEKLILDAAKNCKRPVWSAWAVKWLAGVDRTEESARLAAIDALEDQATSAGRMAWHAAHRAAIWRDRPAGSVDADRLYVGSVLFPRTTEGGAQ